jgi:hypothetical protein
MDYFAGLDVSVKETRVCIVDDAGRIAMGQQHAQFLTAQCLHMATATIAPARMVVSKRHALEERAD